MVTIALQLACDDTINKPHITSLTMNLDLFPKVISTSKAAIILMQPVYV